MRQGIFKRAKRQRGAVLFLGAIMIIGLFAFTGLAIDVGYLQMTKLRAQAAADAAAEAALFELKSGNTDLVAAGLHDSAMNGFTNGANSTTVTINNPPLQGSFAGSNSAVEAVVTRTVPTFFMGVLKFNNVNVTAYASGKIVSTSLGCIYALNGTASRSLNLAGSNSDTFSCSAIVESNSSTAFHMEGSGTLNMAANTTVGVVGPTSCPAASPGTLTNCGLDLTGQTQVCGPSTCPASTHLPTATGIANPGDPLSAIVAPTITGTTVRQASAGSAWDMNHLPTSNTFQPGIYCGGITVNNTNGATFTFAAGTYIMGGGGFLMQGGSKVTGTGVTIYNTSGATAGCSGSPAFAPMNINGQATVTLSAPTTGSLAGILFFQDRSVGSTSTQNQIVGQSTTILNGALYFKPSQLLFSGNGSSTGYMMLVADTISINGNSTVYQQNSPLSGSGTARAIPALGQ